MHKPKLARIIKNDPIAKAAVFFFVLVWILFLWALAVPFLPEALQVIAPVDIREQPYYLKFVIIDTAIGVTVLLVRIWYIFYVFNKGDIIGGKILVLRAYRSKIYIFFEYEYNGRNYERSGNMPRIHGLANLQSGDPITLVVNKNNPSQVLVRERYV
jgi:hypothetical protein